MKRLNAQHLGVAVHYCVTFAAFNTLTDTLTNSIQVRTIIDTHRAHDERQPFLGSAASVVKSNVTMNPADLISRPDSDFASPHISRGYGICVTWS
jgi:hypothetical protein